MNRHCFRLVKSAVVDMLVPVWEGARRHARACGAAGVVGAAFASAAMAQTPPSPAANALPVPVLAIDSANIAASGAATAHLDAARATLDVTQSTQRAIIDWQSFNVGANATVNFNHLQGASSATLNRIHDLAPSVIQGAIRANGEIYLQNDNGVIFKDGAQVNAGSLVISALRIHEDAFNRGLLSLPVGTAAFTWGGTLQQFEATEIRVEAGAAVRSAAGGRVMMLAPKVVNQGTVSAPEGQAVLAAGAKVFLTAPTNPSLRGFLVEVDPYVERDANGATVATVGGAVSNDVMGRVIAERGNASLVGFAVKQHGTAAATTSVLLNGSVMLVARDSVTQGTTVATTVVDNVAIPRGTRTGTVEFGPGSITVVGIESGDAQTLQDAQSFTRSTIDVVGRTIHVLENARLSAPGGDVSLTAMAGQILQLPGSARVDGVRVYIDKGGIIDVAGTTDTRVSVARNFVAAELRGNELRDSPLQRNGILRGATVTVDARLGTPLADVSGYVGQIGRTASERSSAGGTIALVSEGDIVVREGSRLDVSGGHVQYLDDALATETILLGVDGRAYRMSEARSDIAYTGVLGRRVEFQTGYREGKDAGTLTVVAHRAVLEGTLKGAAEAGPRQRDAGLIPSGGRLVIGDASDASAAQADFKIPGLVFAHGGERLPLAFGADAPLEGPWTSATTLSPALFTTDGFTRFAGYTNGLADVTAALALSSGGSFALTARQVRVGADITIPAGTIALTSRDVLGGNVTRPTDFALDVAAGVTLSTAGLWVNDRPDVRSGLLTDPIALRGGTVALRSGSDLSLGTGSVIDVSGGAHLASRGAVTVGDAGSVTLATGRIGRSDSDRQVSTLTLGGTMRGFGLATDLLAAAPTVAKGGSLSLSASSLRVGAGGAMRPGELVLPADIVNRGGFQSFTFSGRDGVEIDAGSVMSMQPQHLVFGGADRLRPNGTAIVGFGTPAVLPEALRTGGRVAFMSSSPEFGHITIGTGAVVDVAPKGELALQSGRDITVHGTLRVPGGTLTLANEPPGSSERFEDDVSLWFGPTAVLDVSGRSVVRQDVLGRWLGEVIDGGTITVSARKGYVVAEAGARIDASGSAGEIDIRVAGVAPRYERRTIASAGGVITLSAREAILSDATLRARAGGTGAMGGTLSVRMDEAPAGIDLPANPKRIVLVPDGQFVVPGGGRFPDGVVPGSPVEAGAARADAAVNGRAFLTPSAIRDGGFDVVALTARDAVEFAGPVDLAVPRAIHIDAPAIGATGTTEAVLRSAYVRLGSGEVRPLEKVATAGHGVVAVEAARIDLVGRLATQGIASTTLHSSGDIRLVGAVVDTDTNPNVDAYGIRGSFLTAGRLSLAGAQLYPTTMTSFTIRAEGTPDSSVVISATPGTTPGAVLSAAGKLTVISPRIEQRGVVKAPFGEIALVASERLELASGSVTSVSGEGLTVPLGRTEQSGNDYVYALGNGFGNVILSSLPAKRVSLESPVTLLSGTVDVSGGGELFAYEFTPGPGGSSDVLDPAKNPTSFAIVPSLGDGFGPGDVAYAAGTVGLSVGDRVHLSGVEGLPAGRYPLLPARYALLPGAYLVTPRAGTRDLTPAQAVTRIDGTQVVSGYRVALHADGTEVRDARTQGFLVESASVIRARAEYSITTATRFFGSRDASSLPRDAGQVRIAATDSLTIDGLVRGAAATGGRGAEADFAVARLALVGATGTGPAGYLSLDAAALARLGAASLLLGGYRDRETDGVRVTATATDVVVMNGSDALVGPEILLVARDTLTVKSGSTIEARGPLPAAMGTLTVAGNGALIRVTTGPMVPITRSAADRTAGTLTIESAPEAVTRLAASGALSLDATRATTVAAGAVLQSGAISVAAGRVSVGEVPAGVDGFVLTPDLLSQVSAADSLFVKSYGALELFGAVSLGGLDDTGRPRLATLTLDAGQWVAHGASSKQLTASTIQVLGAAAPATASSIGTEVGEVVLHAVASEGSGGDIVFGSGSVTAAGASQLVLRADRSVRFEGVGLLAASSDVRVETALLTGSTGADHGIRSLGRLDLAGAPRAPTATEGGLGGRLAFDAAEIRLGSAIVAPSGAVTLHARGSDGVTVAATGRVDVAGRPVVFGERETRVSAGGRVHIEADAGDIEIGDGAFIDVGAASVGSGSAARTGDAGRLELVATQGSAEVTGALIGLAGADARTAEFHADTRELASFSTLNARLNAGGFGDRDIRVRRGDLVVGADDTVIAQRLALSADDGAIAIRGRLDGTAASGGTVELWASGDVVVASGARIDVTPETDGGRGGRLTIGTTAGAIDLQAGARIDLSSRRAGVIADSDSLGRLWLRAPRSGNDVAIRTLGAALDDPDAGTSAAVGRSAVIVEATRVYTASTIAATGQTGVGGVFNLSTTDNASTRNFREDAVYRETSAYVTAAKSAVLARLGGDVRFLPGIEIRSTQQLTLNADWNLCGTGAGCTGTAAWRFDGEPGVLTLRSGGDLALSRSLSDGFNGVAPTATQQVTQSWSYRLAGGADLGAADPRRVVALPLGADGVTEVGSVSLSAGRLVRTGTGFIQVAAGRDVTLANDQAVIYTAGSPTVTQPAELVDFVVPRYTLPAIPIPTYPTSGGDLTITAAGDLQGTASGQLVSEWLYRQAWRLRGVALEVATNPQHTWWVRFDTFRQGVGALGGGDVTVAAGGDIRDFSAVVPTNARLGGGPTAVPDARYFVEQGGGDLAVRADGDLRGGVYYVQKGTARVEAGGSIQASDQLTPDGQPLHTVVALGDARALLRAGGAVTLETAFNPTVQAQPSGNTGTNGRASSYFFTYGERSSVAIEALAGDARLSNQQEILPKLPGSALASRSSEAATSVIYPGSVSAIAFSRDVAVDRTFTLFPSAQGQLDLLAARDVLVRGTINMSDVSPAALPGAISRHGLAPDAIAQVLTPGLTFTERDGIRELLVDAVEQGARHHGETVLHANDAVPIRIIASGGDIRGPGSYGEDVPFGLFAEPVTAVAGRDIRDVWIYGQNVRATDISLFEAGRDVRYALLRDALGVQRANNGRLEWGGPGALAIVAGRDVDLGNSQGLVTRGNFNNPYLPEIGAAIRVSTGTTRPDYDAFLRAYFAGDSAVAQTYGVELAAATTGALFDLGNAPTVRQVRDALVSRYASRIADLPDPVRRSAAQAAFDRVVANMDGVIGRDGDRAVAQAELIAFYGALPHEGEGSVQRALLDDAVSAFSARTREQQAASIQDALFRELRDTGRDYIAGAAPDYLRGYRALLALYPVRTVEGDEPVPETLRVADLDSVRDHWHRDYPGSLNLFFSQIKTEQGGNVDLLVPGGLVNAGLANPGALSKSPSQLGIVTVRGGDVRAAVQDGFLVNQSRVFTLRGGDIVLWSSFGDIDAGKGAKTARATPPPQIVFRGDRFVLDTSRSIEGSGIGALSSVAGVAPGDVDLIAPRGAVDAGDASIRATTIRIAAETIRNEGNIQGSLSSNVSLSSSTPAGGIATGVSDVSAEATKAAAKAADAAAEKAAAQAAALKLSFITVEVTGIGIPGSGATASDDQRAVRSGSADRRRN